MEVMRAFGAAALLACLTTPAFATAYNVVTDYSSSSNPNGVWSYRDASGNLLTSNFSASVNTGWSNGGNYPGGSFVVANQGVSSQTDGTVFYAPDSLHLDGQGVGAEVRFTAPAAGLYTIIGEFSYGDTNMATHAVEILSNISNTAGTEFSQSLSNSQSVSFSLSNVSLATGDYLDFVSTNSGGPSYAGTNLQLTVTDAETSDIPEPGTFSLLFGAGLIGLRMLRRRTL